MEKIEKYVPRALKLEKKHPKQKVLLVVIVCLVIYAVFSAIVVFPPFNRIEYTKNFFWTVVFIVVAAFILMRSYRAVDSLERIDGFLSEIRSAFEEEKDRVRKINRTYSEFVSMSKREQSKEFFDVFERIPKVTSLTYKDFVNRQKTILVQNVRRLENENFYKGLEAKRLKYKDFRFLGNLYFKLCDTVEEYIARLKKEYWSTLQFAEDLSKGVC